MEELARVYSQALFEAAKEQGKIDLMREQLGQLTDVLEKRKEREELMERTRREIEAETRRALDEIRKEVADLTVLATEKVTRKALDADDQRRLVEEALSEVDFSALAGREAPSGGGPTGGNGRAG